MTRKEAMTILDEIAWDKARLQRVDSLARPVCYMSRGLLYALVVNMTETTGMNIRPGRCRQVLYTCLGMEVVETGEEGWTFTVGLRRSMDAFRPEGTP